LVRLHLPDHRPQSIANQSIANQQYAAIAKTLDRPWE
jgi:hypothetical protein